MLIQGIQWEYHVAPHAYHAYHLGMVAMVIFMVLAGELPWRDPHRVRTIAFTTVATSFEKDLSNEFLSRRCKTTKTRYPDGTLRDGWVMNVWLVTATSVMSLEFTQKTYAALGPLVLNYGYEE